MPVSLPTFSCRDACAASVLNSDHSFRGTDSSENPAAHTERMTSIACSSSGRAPRPIRRASATSRTSRQGSGQPVAGRPVALRAAPRRAGRFPPSHAGQRRGPRLHGRADGDRNLARDEHRRSAQDPGLRADGTARLRPDFRDAAQLACSGPKPAVFADKSGSRRGGQPPLNSGLRSDIRALNSGRGIRHSGARPPPPCRSGFISNISKA